MTQNQNSIQGLSSYEAEYNLLCIFYQHKDALGYLAEKITPDFFTDINKILFTAIFELYQTGMSIDVITIAHMLKKLPNGNRVPENHLYNLSRPVSIDKIEAYLSILTEEYNTRRTRTMCIEIEKALKEKKSSSAISEIVQKYSFDTNLGSSRPKNISVVAENYKKELQEDIIAGNDTETRLLKFGVEELDRHDSMRPGNIYTFAGRPSQGKSSIALQILHYNSFNKKKRVAIFSLEMSGYELLEKMYCFHHLIDSQTYIKMKPEKKLKEIQKFEAYLVANEIEFIIDDECKTLSSILNRVKVLNAQKKVDLVCIDYIQLIEASLSNRNKADEIELIMNSIKNDIAMKYKCVVITLSQMSKALEKEGYRFPILADLLNGGAIESASTSVYFIHSVPTNIRRFFDDEGTMQNNGEHLFVAHKVRYGQKGILKMWFAGGANKFVRDFSEREKILSEVEKRCQDFMKN